MRPSFINTQFLESNLCRLWFCSQMLKHPVMCIISCGISLHCVNFVFSPQLQETAKIEYLTLISTWVFEKGVVTDKLILKYRQTNGQQWDPINPHLAWHFICKMISVALYLSSKKSVKWRLSKGFCVYYSRFALLRRSVGWLKRLLGRQFDWALARFWDWLDFLRDFFIVLRSVERFCTDSHIN